MRTDSGQGTPEWSIQEIAKAAGTTSRTLRHYQTAGLLQPSRVGHNGYRYYDGACLLRLQRILLLRQLGLGLDEIRGVLQGRTDTIAALRTHLEVLLEERDRLDRRIASVRTTIGKSERGATLMPEEMFDGFDHTQYKDEVEQRWGKEAYARGDRWWRGLGEEGRRAWLQRSRALQADWIAAAGSDAGPDSADAQDLARRQFDWLAGANGGQEVSYAYFTGLGEMYVADPRFGANYGGDAGARFVRDAMRVYADRYLV
ncbi:TipAS antibiotic-recognition domain-containing protein [Arthrobacter sp. I2-34]|uniref:TipAS antibiotic-recognition domain-containing protein n=1 Tax=Arthrobacter hankyongi TaxID=2904801 RepID=A0ABS9L9H0_9MICC|nr:TipAS antibiotic-recognition domain-containing protein [Arthrobacter hankyongi]MCG2623285.1 TipAS antibiotic-recognition domain-containing protein [Arthrobacter hankyongi]